MASRDFMTSVVVGKDAVPRIGMHQAETLSLLVMRIVSELFHPFSNGAKNGLIDRPLFRD